MRSLGNVGYGIAEMGIGLWENPGSGFTGTAKAVANFGPETFNFGVNTLKTVLDGYTLLAETAGLQEGSLQSFRDSDPFNITPLFSYDSPAESGGALLSGFVSGAAYTKLNRLRSLTDNTLVNGAAFRHRTEWKPNPTGPRSVDDALRLADDYGVYIADDVKIRFIDDAEYDFQFSEFADSYASYGHIRTQNLDQQLTFRSALTDKDGNVNVFVRNSVLDSDEAIVALLHHETHEIESLRDIFAKRVSLSAREYGRLINDSTPGNLHWEAVDIGDQAVWQLRQDRGL
jgi:hypothetical protein